MDVIKVFLFLLRNWVTENISVKVPLNWIAVNGFMNTWFRKIEKALYDGRDSFSIMSASISFYHSLVIYCKSFLIDGRAKRDSRRYFLLFLVIF